MKSIAFFNNKGGVGKTTLLCNLAGHFGLKLGQRVLIIDADPQSNATAYLLPSETLQQLYNDENSANLYEYYEPIAAGRGYSEQHPTISQSIRFGVDLLPGHPRFALREDLLAKDWGDTLTGNERGLQTTFAFRHLLSEFKDSYDFVFIDMGPSLGAINRSILLSADYFITPMSADLFSLMAIENIILSLATWRDDLSGGLGFFERRNGAHYVCDGETVRWKLLFLGYVMQQYKAKSVRGELRAVGSYDRIIQQFPADIEKLNNNFGRHTTSPVDLGRFPSLYSLVPMSQSAHAPIFSLGSADGVVGAHFSKVDEAGEMFAAIAERLKARMAEVEGAPND